MIEQAQTNGPQVITRHGQAVAQMLATRPGGRAASAPDADHALVACLRAEPLADALAMPLHQSRRLVLG